MIALAIYQQLVSIVRTTCIFLLLASTSFVFSFLLERARVLAAGISGRDVYFRQR
jgi:hypothetical protein